MSIMCLLIAVYIEHHALFSGNAGSSRVPYGTILTICLLSPSRNPDIALIPNHHRLFTPADATAEVEAPMWPCRNFSRTSEPSGRKPVTLRAMEGFTKRLGWPVTGCLVTNGRVMETASLSARSAPTRVTSPTDAEVCKRRRPFRMLRKAGERAAWAAVREVKALSPPPESGCSRTQKKVGTETN